MNDNLTFEKIIDIAKSIGPPIKPPIILVTGQITGVWRGTWQDQEYFVIDRAIEHQLRQQIATGRDNMTFGGVPMLGITIMEDDALVAAMLLSALIKDAE